MNADTLRSVLLWSGLINYAILILWVVMALAARSFYSRIATWFGVTAEQYNVIQLAGIIFYKMVIWTFFLVPYIALRIVG